MSVLCCCGCNRALHPKNSSAYGRYFVLHLLLPLPRLFQLLSYSRSTTDVLSRRHNLEFPTRPQTIGVSLASLSPASRISTIFSTSCGSSKCRRAARGVSSIHMRNGIPCRLRQAVRGALRPLPLALRDSTEADRFRRVKENVPGVAGELASAATCGGHSPAPLNRLRPSEARIGASSQQGLHRGGAGTRAANVGDQRRAASFWNASLDRCPRRAVRRQGRRRRAGRRGIAASSKRRRCFGSWASRENRSC